MRGSSYIANSERSGVGGMAIFARGGVRGRSNRPMYQMSAMARLMESFLARLVTL
jgi:hypothetical protein